MNVTEIIIRIVLSLNACIFRLVGPPKKEPNRYANREWSLGLRTHRNFLEYARGAEETIGDGKAGERYLRIIYNHSNIKENRNM